MAKWPHGTWGQLVSPDEGWCEARLFEKSNDASQINKNLIWILSLTLIQGKALLWLRVLAQWKNSRNLTWNGGFRMRKERRRQAVTALSLICSLDLSIVLCKMRLWSFPHRIHHLWNYKARFSKKQPDRKSAILPVDSLLRVLWYIESIHIPSLSTHDTEQCRSPQHLIQRLRDLELRGLCLDNFWETQTPYKDSPKLRPSWPDLPCSHILQYKTR